MSDALQLPQSMDSEVASPCKITEPDVDFSKTLLVFGSGGEITASFRRAVIPGARFRTRAPWQSPKFRFDAHGQGSSSRILAMVSPTTPA
jgi:hypothetical protein